MSMYNICKENLGYHQRKNYIYDTFFLSFNGFCYILSLKPNFLNCLNYLLFFYLLASYVNSNFNYSRIFRTIKLRFKGYLLNNYSHNFSTSRITPLKSTFLVLQV